MYSKEYPIKRIQIERACRLAGELCYRYGIRITNRTVRTHAEVGQQLPHSTSYGKIDINSLPCACVYGIPQVGNWIRDKVNWYRSKII